MLQPDQRNDARTPLSTRIHVLDIESGVEFAGSAVDSSRSGLAFDAGMEPAVGAEMEVTFVDIGAHRALFKVLRIDTQASGYRVSGEMAPTRW